MLNVRKESIRILRLKRKILQVNLILQLFFQSLWNVGLHDTHPVTHQFLPPHLILSIFFFLSVSLKSLWILSVLKVETEQEEWVSCSWISSVLCNSEVTEYFQILLIFFVIQHSTLFEKNPACDCKHSIPNWFLQPLN